jgi:hypothetical protein
MIGQRFGKLAVTASGPPYVRPGTTDARPRWHCRCDCGGEALVEQSNLRTGNSTSCGCAGSRASIGSRSVKHGQARRQQKRRLYKIWGMMKQRCSNPNNKDYYNYGGRGIVVCQRWERFENFHADMGDPPDGMSLDRIDPSGHYEPSNCRWLSQLEQQRNRATHHPYIPVSLLVEALGRDEAMLVIARVDAARAARKHRAMAA